MKAIILAAGEGTRLRPHTASVPKCLVPLKGRPLLAHQMDALAACGIRDVVAVTGYRREALAGWPVRDIPNPRWAETNMVASLFCAEDEMDDDLLVAYGDLVYEPRVVRAVLEAPARFAVAVDVKWRDLWAFRGVDPLADAETLKLGLGGRILEIGKRPRSADEIEAQYLGLFRIGRDALPGIRAFYRALDRGADYDGATFDRMYMTSFIDLVAKRMPPVTAATVEHGWLEVDTAEDLRRYEAMGPADARLFAFEERARPV